MLVVGIQDSATRGSSTAHLLLLAIVISIMAPLGDLTESMFKRNLDVKDFGTIVRGHGGVLDRFDGFLFTLPGRVLPPAGARALGGELTVSDRRSVGVRRSGSRIAGSTGSIGTQTLDVIRAENARARLVRGRRRSASVVGRRRWSPRRTSSGPTVVAVADPAARAEVAAALPSSRSSADLADLVEPADVVVNGVVGFAGLPVTIATLRAGKRLALANKESLIAAGPVVQPLRSTPGAELVPVDSEHCAVHQCLRSSADARPRGRPARASPPVAARSAADRPPNSPTSTVESALAHPTWSMGPKITIDSSTLMNKGLEVIEAHELFGTPYDQIDVVVHPQSVIHSMVEFTDGSTIAQLSMPDMRLPIGYALGYPTPIASPFGRSTGRRSVGSTSSRPIDGVPLPRPRLRGRARRRHAVEPDARTRIAIAAAHRDQAHVHTAPAAGHQQVPRHQIGFA